MLHLVWLDNKETQIFGICFTELHAFLLSVKVIILSYSIMNLAIFISSFSLFWIYALPFWFIFRLHWANEIYYFLRFDILHRFRSRIFKLKGDSFRELQFANTLPTEREGDFQQVKYSQHKSRFNELVSSLKQTVVH